jgi:hypothetical protein
MTGDDTGLAVAAAMSVLAAVLAAVVSVGTRACWNSGMTGWSALNLSSRRSRGSRSEERVWEWA